MLNKLRKTKLEKSNQGFTIIEVMIVLAIAGLILLIVFLAVPALQRNSRNTQRKADVSAIASTLAQFISNNNGKLPTGLGKNADVNILDICSAGGAALPAAATPCTAGKNIENVKFGYYTDANVAIRLAPASTDTVATQAISVNAPVNAAASKINYDQAIIINKASCGDTQGTIKPSPRSIAVFYVTEAGSGDGSVQCLEQ